MACPYYKDTASIGSVHVCYSKKHPEYNKKSGRAFNIPGSICCKNKFQDCPFYIDNSDQSTNSGSGFCPTVEEETR